MSRRTKAVLCAVAVALLKALRFAAYVLLLLVGRLLRPVVGLAVGMGLIVFLFCLVFARGQATIMWAGGALAVAAIVVQVLHDVALRLVAPAGTVIVSDV